MTTLREKAGLIAWYYSDKIKGFARNLKLSDPKAWNPALWNLIGMGKSWAGNQVDEFTALNFSAVYNAINLIAGTIASLPFHVKAENKAGRKRILYDHPVHQFFSIAPNDEMIAMAFRSASMAHVLGWGNWYSEIVRDMTGRIAEVWPITPDRVDVKRINGKIVYEINVGSDRVTLPKERVLHIAGLGYDGIVGYSVIQKARQAIGLGLAAEEFGARFFGNNTNMGIVVKYPRALGKDAKDQFRDAMKEYEGLGKSHRFMILDQGIEIEKIGINPDDSQFLQTRQFQIPDIARWFNIPPHFLKDLSRATFSNIEQQAIEFVQYTLTPWLVCLEQNLNYQLLSEKERKLGYFCKFSVEGLLRGDSASRAAFYNSLFQNGAITPNEIRALEDKDPIDGGDKAFVQLNMVPLSDAGKPIEPVVKEKAPVDIDETEAEETEEKALIWSESPFKAIEYKEKREISHKKIHGLLRLERAHYNSFLSTFQQIVNRESLAIKKAVKTYIGERSISEMTAWLEDFYDEHRKYFKDKFGPILEAYMKTIHNEASSIIGVEPELSSILEQFIKKYMDIASLRYVNGSKNQINKIIQYNKTDLDKLYGDINNRLDEWYQKKANKYAADEIVRSSNAIARETWISNGVTKMQWQTVGENCPFCNGMAGRIVDIQKNFIDAGNVIYSGDEGDFQIYDPSSGDFVSKEGEGKSENWQAMKVYGNKAHPPIHQG